MVDLEAEKAEVERQMRRISRTETSRGLLLSESSVC